MRRRFSISLFILLNLLLLFPSPVAYSQLRKVDLTGNWVGKNANFTLNDTGCTAGSSDGRLEINGRDTDQGVEFEVIQKGNQLTIPDRLVTWSNGGSRGSYTHTHRGSISGSKIRIISSGNLEGGFTTEAVGTISADGNTVTGEVLCRGVRGSATARGTFIWTRKNFKELTEEPTKKDIDAALKKRGFPDSDYPYYERPNGCSNSPDSNWFNSGTGFKPACDNHDRCYSTVGKSKRTCDDNFKADMDKICATGTPVIGCSRAATLYYRAVVKHGASAYTTAQKEAKKYQVEVEKFKKEWRQKIGR